MVYKFFDKKSALIEDKSASGSGIKNENISNQELAEELHEPIIKKFKKRKVHSTFVYDVWGVDLAVMQLISKLITGINESKILTKHISWSVNVDLMEENVIKVNDGIVVNVNMSVKNVMYVKKILFGILLHEIVKMENIQQVFRVIRRLRAMKLQSHTTEKQILMKKSNL